MRDWGRKSWIPFSFGWAEKTKVCVRKVNSKSQKNDNQENKSQGSEKGRKGIICIYEYEYRDHNQMGKSYKWKRRNVAQIQKIDPNNKIICRNNNFPHTP